MSVLNNKNNHLLFGLLSTLFIGLVYNLGFNVQQTEFNQIIVNYSLLFGLYLILLKHYRLSHFSMLLGVAIVCRCFLVFSTPLLSDDIYRFLWDGYLSVQGINPFTSTPNQIIEGQVITSGYLDELYPLLNSKEYNTIYPPFAQFTFLLPVVFAQSVSLQIIFLKVILLGFELGAIWVVYRLLKTLKMDFTRVFVYGLNPLVIIEVMGNCHYEGILMFFLLLSVYFGIGHRQIFSSASFASSIASKMTSLMYLPLWIRYKGIQKSFAFYSIIGITLILYFLPLIDWDYIMNFRESLGLYFQTFEFNGSFYYVARWVGFQYKGWNMIDQIGPFLSGFTILAIVFLSILQNRDDHQRLLFHMLIAISVYLFCTTTVHPWYIIIPLSLGLFTDRQFPILWSFLTIWSYSHYAGGQNSEQYGWIVAEYVILFGFILWEAWCLRKSRIEIS